MLKHSTFISATFIVLLVLLAFPALAEMIVDIAWLRRYNGPGNSSDYACAIAVDNSGNVYVTGYSEGSGTAWDYATIKYYPNGDTAWVRRYNGPGNDDDKASAIAVDDSGNVYVTGWSTGIGYDYATIKYYPNGDTAWVRRYNGPGNYNNGATAIAVDGSGNAYVTGNSYGSVTDNDYATIKYYPNGDTAWVRRYVGSGTSNADQAEAISVDLSGNVYVTGSSDWGGTLSSDYATIKYNPTGDTVWVRRYNGPGNGPDYAYDLSVDGSGNVYVTGSSYGSGGTDMDYATVKYNSLGEFLWVRRYHGGPAGSDDRAFSCGVDSSSNVYVTGISNDGDNYDYVTTKYNASGDLLWVRAYNGPGNSEDYANDLAVDASGNVFVTGRSAQNSYSPYNDDYTTVGYNPHGDTLWVRRYNGSGDAEDWAFALVIDNSNNVYVTGGSDGYVAGYDYATIKYFQALRGDVNRDGVINSTDVVYLINYLFIGGPPPTPLVAGDANCDAAVNVTDVVYLINYLFIGGPPPCEP